MLKTLSVVKFNNKMRKVYNKVYCTKLSRKRKIYLKLGLNSKRI